MDAEIPGGQRGGDGVDQERRVVGDDLDHGVADVRCGLGDPHPRHAGQPLSGELAVRHRGGEHVLGGTADQLLVGDQASVVRGQPAHLGGADLPIT